MVSRFLHIHVLARNKPRVRIRHDPPLTLSQRAEPQRQLHVVGEKVELIPELACGHRLDRTVEREHWMLGEPEGHFSIPNFLS